MAGAPQKPPRRPGSEERLDVTKTIQPSDEASNTDVVEVLFKALQIASNKRDQNKNQESASAENRVHVVGAQNQDRFEIPIKTVVVFLSVCAALAMSTWGLLKFIDGFSRIPAISAQPSGTPPAVTVPPVAPSRMQTIQPLQRSATRIESIRLNEPKKLVPIPDSVPPEPVVEARDDEPTHDGAEENVLDPAPGLEHDLLDEEDEELDPEAPQAKPASKKKDDAEVLEED